MASLPPRKRSGMGIYMGTWRDHLRKIEPYVPGEQPDLPDMIKLNTNENPYPPSPKVMEALRSFDSDILRLYPDPDSRLLADALADRYGVSRDQVFLGVGSDDVLAIAFMTFFHSEKPVLFPDITYSFYDVWAGLFQIPYRQPALDQSFDLIREDYYNGDDARSSNGGVVIANPNAPTGVEQGVDLLRDILLHNRDVVVIVDEAYADFGKVSALELIREFDNLLVVRTFSKSRSLAGMRIGYAIGQPDLIRAMNDVRYSYNSYPMTRLSVALGVAALQDEAYFQETVGRIIQTREWTKGQLRQLGFDFPDSQANFIFATHERVPAQTIFDKLREKHIFVRHFHHARIEDHLRISIGTQQEMERFIRELRQIVLLFTA